jgi:hypothetical protein
MTSLGEAMPGEIMRVLRLRDGLIVTRHNAPTGTVIRELADEAIAKITHTIELAIIAMSHGSAIECLQAYNDLQAWKVADEPG